MLRTCVLLDELINSERPGGAGGPVVVAEVRGGCTCICAHVAARLPGHHHKGGTQRTEVNMGGTLAGCSRLLAARCTPTLQITAN